MLRCWGWEKAIWLRCSGLLPLHPFQFFFYTNIHFCFVFSNCVFPYCGSEVVSCHQVSSVCSLAPVHCQFRSFPVGCEASLTIMFFSFSFSYTLKFLKSACSFKDASRLAIFCCWEVCLVFWDFLSRLSTFRAGHAGNSWRSRMPAFYLEKNKQNGVASGFWNGAFIFKRVLYTVQLYKVKVK